MKGTNKNSTRRTWSRISCLALVVFSFLLLNACDEIDLGDLNIGCEHTWGEWSVVTEATCEAAGERQRICSKCSSTETEAVSALSHDYGEWSVSRAATCTEDGEETRVCSHDPKHVETRKIEKTAHVYDKEIADAKYLKSEATCAQAAVYYKSCVCGAHDTAKSATFESGSTEAHVYDKEIADAKYLKSEATCTQAAVYYKSCVCGAHDTAKSATFESGSTEAHVYDREVADAKYLKSEATCTQAAVYYKSCACGAHDTAKSATFESGSTAKHNYVQISFKDATCEADGLKVEKCKGCGDEISTPIVSEGHKYEETVVSPTCLEKGYTEHKCSSCGDTYRDTEVNATGHLEFDDTVIPPTCQSGGYTEHKCKACGFIEKIDLTPVSDHTYKYEVLEEATCTKTGTRKVTCEHCDYESTEIIPKKGHKYTSVTTEATCTVDGYVTHTCACGDSYVTPGEKAEGHDWNTTVVAPSCTEQGYTLCECSCGATEKKDWVKPQGHDYSDPTCSKPAICGCCGDEGKAATQDHKYGKGEIVQKPTCTEKGIIKYKCKNCEHFYTEEIKATGHDTKDAVWEETERCVDGKCSYVKVRTAKCNVCGHDVTEESEPYEKHTYVAVITLAATCSSNGEKQYKCSVCGARPEKNATVSYSEPTAHVWVEKSSTETTKTYECSECHVKKTVVHSSGSSASVGSSDLKNSGGVSLGGTEIELDQETKDQLGELAATQNITVSVNKIEGESREDIASEDQLKYIGDAPIYDLTMLVGDSNKISKFSGTVTVRIPYTLGEKEDPDDITIWYIDDDGNVTTVEGASYVVIGGEGYAVFETDHFSYYTVTKLTPEQRCARDGHEYKTIKQTATCTSDGYVMRVCTRCGEKTVISTESALNHSWKQSVIEKATCTSAGRTEHKCEFCEAVYHTAIAATGHKWVVSETVEATCTEAGYEIYVCEHDEEHTYRIVLPQAGHSYISKTVEPTCISEGYTEHTCTECKTSYVSDRVATAEHKIVTNVVAPTCISEGYTEQFCEVCEKRFENIDIVGVSGHIWDIEEPTCDRGQTCTVCKAAGAPATGIHNMTEEGKCSDCGKLCEHSFYKATTYAPECGKDGYTEYVCSYCKMVEKRDVLPATDHKWTETESKKATCSEDGYVKYKCSSCGDERFEEIKRSEELHHTISKVISPTCTEEGYTVHYCDVCDVEFERTDKVAATGHDYKETSRNDATCTENGVIEYTCTLCGGKKTEDIPSTGHKHEEAERVEPTCEEDGYLINRCPACKDEIREVIPATGHSFSLTEEIKSTCKDNGKKVYECASCKASYTEKLPLADHNFADGKCTVCGDKENTCVHADIEDCVVTYTFVNQETRDCVDGVEVAYTCPNCRQVIYREIRCSHFYVRENLLAELGSDERITVTRCAACGEGHISFDVHSGEIKEDSTYDGNDGHKHTVVTYYIEKYGFEISCDYYTVSNGCEESTNYVCVVKMDGKEPVEISFAEKQHCHEMDEETERAFDEKTMTATEVTTHYCRNCNKIMGRVTRTTKYVANDVPCEYTEKTELSVDAKGSSFVTVEVEKGIAEYKLVDGKYVCVKETYVTEIYALDGSIAMIEESIEQCNEAGESVYFYAAMSAYICGEKQILGFEEENYIAVTLPNGKQVMLICSNEAAEYDINGNCLDGYLERYTYKTVEGKNCELETTVTYSDGTTETFINTVHADIVESYEFDSETHNCSSGITVIKTCRTCGEEIERSYRFYHDMESIETIDASEVGCECGGSIDVVECKYCGYQDVYFHFNCDMNHGEADHDKPDYSDPDIGYDEENSTAPMEPGMDDEENSTAPMEPGMDDEEGFGEIVYPTTNTVENMTADASGSSYDVIVEELPKEDIGTDIGTDIGGSAESDDVGDVSRPNEDVSTSSVYKCNKCGFTYKIETLITKGEKCQVTVRRVYSFGMDSDGNFIKVIELQDVETRHMNVYDDSFVDRYQETQEDGTVLIVIKEQSTTVCGDCGKTLKKQETTVKRDRQGNTLYLESIKMEDVGGALIPMWKNCTVYEYFTDTAGKVGTRKTRHESYKYNESGEVAFSESVTYTYDPQIPCKVTVTEKSSDGYENEYVEENHAWKEVAELVEGAKSCEDGVRIVRICTYCGCEDGDSFVIHEHVTERTEIFFDEYGVPGAALIIDECLCGERTEASFDGGGHKYSVETNDEVDSNGNYCSVETGKLRDGDFWYKIEFCRKKDGCKAVEYVTYSFGTSRSEDAIIEKTVNLGEIEQHSYDDIVSEETKTETDENGQTLTVVVEKIQHKCRDCQKVIGSLRNTIKKDANGNIVFSKSEHMGVNEDGKEHVFASDEMASIVVTDAGGEFSLLPKYEISCKYDPDGTLVDFKRKDYEYIGGYCKAKIRVTDINGKEYVEETENHGEYVERVRLADGAISCKDGVVIEYVCKRCGEVAFTETVYHHHLTQGEISLDEFGCGCHEIAIYEYCPCGEMSRVSFTKICDFTIVDKNTEAQNGLPCSYFKYQCSRCGFVYTRTVCEEIDENCVRSIHITYGFGEDESGAPKKVLSFKRTVGEFHDHTANSTVTESTETDQNGIKLKVVTTVQTEICSKCNKVMNHSVRVSKTDEKGRILYTEYYGYKLYDEVKVLVEKTLSSYQTLITKDGTEHTVEATCEKFGYNEKGEEIEHTVCEYTYPDGSPCKKHVKLTDFYGNSEEYDVDEHSFSKQIYRLKDGAISCDQGVLVIDVCELCGYENAIGEEYAHLVMSEVLDAEMMGCGCEGVVDISFCACGQEIRVESLLGCSFYSTSEKKVDENGNVHRTETFTCKACNFMYSLESWSEVNGSCERVQHRYYRFGIDKDGKAAVERDLIRIVSVSHNFVQERDETEQTETDENGNSVKIVTSTLTTSCSKCGKTSNRQVTIKKYAAYKDMGEQNVLQRIENYVKKENGEEYLSNVTVYEYDYTRSDVGKLNRRTAAETVEKYDENGKLIDKNSKRYIYNDETPCVYTVEHTDMYGKVYTETVGSHVSGEVSYVLSEGSLTCEDGVDRIARCSVCGVECEREIRLYTDHRICSTPVRTETLEKYGCSHGVVINVCSCACGKVERASASGGRYSVGETYTYTTDSGVVLTEPVYTCPDGCGFKYVNLTWRETNNCEIVDCYAIILGLNTETGEYADIYRAYVSTGSVKHKFVAENDTYEKDGKTVSVSGYSCSECGYIQTRTTTTKYTDENGNTVVETDIVSAYADKNVQRDFEKTVEKNIVAPNGEETTVKLLYRTERYVNDVLKSWKESEYVYDDGVYCSGRVITKRYSEKTGEIEEDESSFENHVGFESKPILESTCTQEGIIGEICMYCGHVVESSVAPKGHIFYPLYDGIYECRDCKLQVTEPTNGGFLLEDLTAKLSDGTKYVVGYFDTYGVGEYKIELFFAIDGKEYPISYVPYNDGKSLIEIDVNAIVKEVNSNNFTPCGYGIGVRIVPVSEKYRNEVFTIVLDSHIYVADEQNSKIPENPCTEETLLAYKCLVCGHSYTETKKAGHDRVYTRHELCDCGYTVNIYTCGVCGETLSMSVGSGKFTSAGSTTSTDENGIVHTVSTNVCSVCGGKYELETYETPRENCIYDSYKTLRWGENSDGTYAFSATLLEYSRANHTTEREVISTSEDGVETDVTISKCKVCGATISTSTRVSKYNENGKRIYSSSENQYEDGRRNKQISEYIFSPEGRSYKSYVFSESFNSEGKQTSGYTEVYEYNFETGICTRTRTTYDGEVTITESAIK